MPRLVPTPSELVERLRRLVPRPDTGRAVDAGASTDERILDAALAAFTANGIRATTMTAVARDAGISREWLYRRFANREALVVAVAQREIGALIDGLAARAFRSDALDDAVTDAFVFTVEHLRDHALLQRVLHSETDVVTPHLLENVPPVIERAVQAGAAYLSALGDLEPAQAAFAAETLVRLVASAVVVPRAGVDLHDGDQLRRYAAAVVPGILGAARALPARQGGRKG